MCFCVLRNVLYLSGLQDIVFPFLKDDCLIGMQRQRLAFADQLIVVAEQDLRAFDPLRHDEVGLFVTEVRDD